jgi:hypothetical protein
MAICLAGVNLAALRPEHLIDSTPPKRFVTFRICSAPLRLTLSWTLTLGSMRINYGMQLNRLSTRGATVGEQSDARRRRLSMSRALPASCESCGCAGQARPAHP